MKRPSGCWCVAKVPVDELSDVSHEPIVVDTRVAPSVVPMRLSAVVNYWLAISGSLGLLLRF